jgi:excisionase family DNA binding protein
VSYPVVEPLALKPSEAARHIGVSKRHLYNLIRAGKIAARKAGNRTLIRVADLAAYVDALPLKRGSAPLVAGKRTHPNKGVLSRSLQ